ncbi:MAG: RDD family protein [Hyphomicrobiales bacterium]
MNSIDTRRFDDTADGPEFAYDPDTQPELFEGVRTRRFTAFLIDAAIILALTLLVGILVFFLGVLTLGFGWLLYGGIFPAVALIYTAMTAGGPNSATIGMRTMGLELRTWYGAKMYHLLAAMHALVFYFSISMLTPAVLLVCLFNGRKRCLHDMLMGTIVINTSKQAEAFNS